MTEKNTLAALRLNVGLEGRIRELETQHGGLRPAARVLDCDVAYLLRLRNGEKKNPSDAMLEKMGLKRVVTYERIGLPSNV